MYVSEDGRSNEYYRYMLGLSMEEMRRTTKLVRNWKEYLETD